MIKRFCCSYLFGTEKNNRQQSKKSNVLLIFKQDKKKIEQERKKPIAEMTYFKINSGFRRARN